MVDKLKQLAQTLHPARLTSLGQYIIRDEAVSGKLIIGAVLLALIATNSPLSSLYEAFWTTPLNIGIGDWSLALDLRHWVSDALMAFFFLVVGLELSRELAHGELKDKRTAALPFAAALGGMIIPAIIYASLNLGSDSLKGWAIPTATDIALAIGVLALLGKRIPSTVRIFLLTLAIVDDIAAVIIIAVFYSTTINIGFVLLAAAITSLLFILKGTRYLTLPLYVIAGLLLWLVMYKSGIHASITGAVLGLLAPLTIRNRKRSIAERIEKAVIPLSTLVIVPLFAFANTGIALTFDSFQNDAAVHIAGGIIGGLVIGKVLGIVGASWLMVRLGLASLPSRSNWNHIVGVGMLAGIGFTVSIFVTDLAFTNEQYISTAKISIFIASATSAILGYFALRRLKPSS